VKGSVAAILRATISANFRDTETLVMKSDAIRQLFCERYLAGIPYMDICRELGISLRTAGNWAREMALPQRTGGPRRKRWMPGKAPKIG
jgi:hypothetical protein